MAGVAVAHAGDAPRGKGEEEKKKRGRPWDKTSKVITAQDKYERLLNTLSEEAKTCIAEADQAEKSVSSSEEWCQHFVSLIQTRKEALQVHGYHGSCRRHGTLEVALAPLSAHFEN